MKTTKKTTKKMDANQEKLKTEYASFFKIQPQVVTILQGKSLLPKDLVPLENLAKSDQDFMTALSTLYLGEEFIIAGLSKFSRTEREALCRPKEVGEIEKWAADEYQAGYTEIFHGRESKSYIRALTHYVYEGILEGRIPATLKEKVDKIRRAAREKASRKLKQETEKI